MPTNSLCKRITAVLITSMFLAWALVSAEDPAALGTLRISIVDEDGKPTPAMLAINNEATGEMVEYGMSPLRVGRHKRNRFPGYSRRPQWQGQAPLDVNGKLEVQLPAGTYSLNAGKGLEYEPRQQTVTLKPGRAADVTLELTRFINLPQKGWWPGDDHVHLKRPDTDSDDDLWVSAMAEGLHVVNSLQMGSYLDYDFPQPAFGRAGRVFKGNRVIVPGQEEPRTGGLGHTIALNIPEFIRNVDHYHQYDRMFKEAKQGGGVTGYAHVMGFAYDAEGRVVDRDGQLINVDDWRVELSRFDCDMGLMVDMVDGLVDFVELLDNNNILMPQLYYDFLNMGFHISASAGSDFPYGCHVGDQRIYVYTGKDEPFDVDRWYDNLRKGHTFITQGPLVEFTVDDAMAGETLHRNKGDQVRVKATATGHPDIGSPARVTLIQFGRELNTATSETPGQRTVTGDWTVPIERSCWLAARVDAHNGAVAHTSPVYIEVDGEPTLDPTQLRRIVEMRLNRIEMLRATIDRLVDIYKERGDPTGQRRQASQLSKDEQRMLLFQLMGKHWSADRADFLQRLRRAEIYYHDLLKQAAD